MPTFAEYARRWAAIDVLKEAAAAVNKHGGEVVNLVRAQMYQDGTDGYDEPLQEYRSQSYAALKHDRNPAPGFGVPDLYDTGAFYGAMFISTTDSTLEVSSSDSKTAELIGKYGNAIFKLTVTSKNTVRQTILKPEMVASIAAKTGASIGIG